MKAVKITLAGRTQYLAYTGEAMFQLQEKFGTAAELLGAIGKNTRDGLSVACEAAAILAEQGELARRHLGYDKGPIIEAATIRATITPSEIAALKLAIPAAMELGYGREVVEENDEIDLGLAELIAQKKTTGHAPTMGGSRRYAASPGKRRSSCLRENCSICGSYGSGPVAKRPFRTTKRGRRVTATAPPREFYS